jgi:2,3-bisphosphoglycerate-independent phosphoglycerate mutase
VDLADTPVFDRLHATHPTTQMAASGTDVGLPAGQIGNSEVGHLNLGAGRVVYQDLTRIDRAVEDGSLARSSELATALREVNERDSTLHIIGLCSHGGVHSSIAHIEAIADAAANARVQRLRVHAITDGRDVSPDASLSDLPALEAALHALGSDYRISTLIGRFWAMDRDRRWERTERAWEAFVHGRAPESATTAAEAVRVSHEAGVTDEFVEPTLIDGGSPVRDGDVVIFANFRPDRMRQIVHAFADGPQFAGFGRGHVPHADLVCMAEYDETLSLPLLFGPSNVADTLADVLAEHGLGQLHVAETEKYAHVTYFFNGGVEDVHAGEERALVPSPRDVPTYDLKPEMSCEGVADEFVAHMANPDVAFAVVNFANPDMVGHTGSIPAAIAACEAVDAQLARVVDAVHARGGTCFITADHGNAEVMLTAEGKPHTAHTTNPVPVIVTVDRTDAGELRSGGRLADVAPTLLDLLAIAQPPAMTGMSLLQPAVVTA